MNVECKECNGVLDSQDDQTPRQSWQDSIFRFREDVDADAEVLCTQVVGHTRSRRPRPRA